MANTLFCKIFNKFLGTRTSEVLTKNQDEFLSASNKSDDELEEFLNTEHDINALYQRRLNIIKDVVFASGDTTDELIDFERNVYMEWINALKDHNKELQDGMRFILTCIQSNSNPASNKDNECQTFIERNNSFTQASDSLVDDLKSDVQMLVKFIQTASDERRWDISGMKLLTLDLKDIFKKDTHAEPNLTPVLTNLLNIKEMPKVASHTNPEFKAMNDRIKELERNLHCMKSENQQLIKELSNLKRKMQKKETEYLQAEKESEDRCKSIERVYRIYLEKAQQTIRKQREINNKLINDHIVEDKLIIEQARNYKQSMTKSESNIEFQSAVEIPRNS